jgi:hypothetical protein
MVKTFKSTRVVCLVAIVLLSSCHASKNAPMNVLANNNKDRDALKEFALCQCLYEVGKYTNEERGEDGSVAPYIEFSSLSIERIEETDAFVKQYLDNTHLSSANNSTLALRKCFMMYKSEQLDKFARGKRYSFFE